MPKENEEAQGAKRELIEIDARGGVSLPDWVWRRLLKKSGIKSKKKRQQKKAVKKEFMKLLRDLECELGLKR